MGVSIVSVKTYPTLFTELGGRDTWIAMIFASAFAILFIDLLFGIASVQRCSNLYQIYTRAAGKPLGTALYLLLAAGFVLNMGESMSMGASTIQEHFLPHFPIWILLFTCVACGFYVVRRGGSAVITTTIITLVLISMSGVVLAILSQRYKNIHLLEPVMGQGVTLPFVWCVIKLLAAYGCVMLAFPYVDGIADKKHLLRHGTFGMLIVAQIQVFCMLGTLMTFDVRRLNELIYPKLTQTQMISYFAFLEAGELFVMLQTVAGWFVKYVLAFLALKLLLEQAGWRLRGVSFVVSGAALALALCVAQNLFVLQDALNWLMLVQLANDIVVPLAVFTVFFFRCGPVQKEKPPETQNGR